MSHISVTGNYNRYAIDKDRIIYKNARPDFWAVSISLVSLAMAVFFFCFIKHRYGFERLYFVPFLPYLIILAGMIPSLFLLRYLVLSLGLLSGATAIDGIIDSYVEDKWHKEHIVNVGPLVKVRLNVKGEDKVIIVPLRPTETVYPAGSLVRLKILGDRAFIRAKK